MHRANISVRATTGALDSLVVPFGVRSISFNSTHGFVLNGVATKMYHLVDQLSVPHEHRGFEGSHWFT